MAPTYRRFICINYSDFWKYYSSIKEEDRHFYELIPEDSPCKLYFDVEFLYKFNNVNGNEVVSLFLKLVNSHLFDCYPQYFNDCSLNFTHIILDATTQEKFSQHIVFISIIILRSIFLIIFILKQMPMLEIFYFLYITKL